MKLKYKILDNRIGTEFDIPRYQTAGSAGMDLIACCEESITLSPNQSTIIPSGISIFIEDNNFAAIVIPRSGLGCLLYTSPSPRDNKASRMPSSA